MKAVSTGESVVCTLFEGHHHFGAGGLLNSLVRNGFTGKFCIGYRGAIPLWMADGSKERTALRSTGIEVSPIEVRTDRHLTCFIASFMLDLANQMNPESSLAYFDPDIVVRAPWEFFENWIRHGVALVEDLSYPTMPNDHPLRLNWLEICEGFGLRQERSVGSYYNAGFIGLRREHAELLKVWDEVIMKVSMLDSSFARLKAGMRWETWYGTDQDALNAAVMCTSVPLSTIGPEGMDFADGGFTMSHAIGNPKPWRKHFVRSALGGFPPSQADKGWLQNSASPIEVISPMSRRLKTLDLRLASAIGRFYHRP